MPRRRRMQARKYAAVLCGALGAAALAPAAAQAGFFDLLFGPSQDQPPPQSYAEPAPVIPAPLAPQSVRQGNGDTGHVVAYCVRLCDGQHFPLEHMANATPVETCRAMCPASKTKVFFGSAIDAAVAGDGTRYGALDNAYLYRKNLVADCTCNGRDAFGLAPLRVSPSSPQQEGDCSEHHGRRKRHRRQGQRFHVRRPPVWGRSKGNRMTSRIDGALVSAMTRRSIPIPRPAARSL